MKIHHTKNSDTPIDTFAHSVAILKQMSRDRLLTVHQVSRVLAAHALQVPDCGRLALGAYEVPT